MHIDRFRKAILRSLVVLGACLAFALCSAMLVPLWRAEVFELFARSWNSFLGREGTTSLGFASNLLTPFACIVLSLLIYYFVEGRRRAISHEQREAKTAIIVLAIVFSSVYVTVYILNLISTISLDHQSLIAAREELKPAREEIRKSRSERMNHCLSPLQVSALASALAKNPSTQGFSSSAVYIAYYFHPVPTLDADATSEPNEERADSRSECVADIVSAFLRAGWQPVLRGSDAVGETRYKGVVFAYFTDSSKLPQYNNLRKAFEEARVPYSEATINFGFNEQASSKPEMVNPIIYISGD